MLFGILKLGLHRRGLSARHKPWPPQLAIGRTVVAQRVSPSKKPKNHKQKSLARAKSSYGAEPVSPYPVMKVSCQIVQSYLVQFFLFGLRLDFVLFGFTIEILRYLDSVGLCWTRVQHPKSLSYVKMMQSNFSRVGLCWTESNIANHYLTSGNFGLTPFRLL